MKLHMNPNTLADLADVIRAMAGLTAPAGIGRNATHSVR